MAVTAQATPSFSGLRDRWGWFVALGILMLVAGIIALFSVFMATIASVVVVGVMMIVSGAGEIISAFRMKEWGQFLLWMAIGILYVVAGFMAFANPLLASAVLTLMLGFFLIFAGVVRIVLAMRMKGDAPWGWTLLSGVITLLLGAMIVLGWPVSSLYTLGIFLGVDLIIAGASWLAAGLALRRA